MWVYILHLDEKLFHAGHYCGSSVKLEKRLIRHAKGQSKAKFTTALKMKGHAWRLATLYSCTNEQDAREIEIQIKRQKHVHRFCTICNGGRLPQFDNATPYDVELLPFPITSHELAERSLPACHTITTTTKHTTSKKTAAK